MDRDIEHMIEASGVSVPLAARIIRLVLDSGASQIEISAAFSIAREILTLSPAPLLAEGVGPAELHSPEA